MRFLVNWFAHGIAVALQNNGYIAKSIEMKVHHSLLAFC